MCFRRFRVRFLFQTRARLRENKRERFKGVKKTKTVENLKRFFFLEIYEICDHIIRIILSIKTSYCNNTMICEDDDDDNETMPLFISSRFLRAEYRPRLQSASPKALRRMWERRTRCRRVSRERVRV